MLERSEKTLLDYPTLSQALPLAILAFTAFLQHAPATNADVPQDRDPTSSASLEKRSTPDFDGRPPPPPSTDEVVIWIPRAILYPVHITLRLTLEKPLVGIIEFVEEHHLHNWIEWLLFWKDGKIGVIPTAFYEFGLHASIGFYFFVNDLIMPNHRLTLTAAFWFEEWRQVTFQNRWQIPSRKRSVATLKVTYKSRPDMLYHGEGPATQDSHVSFFRLSILEVKGGLRAFLPKLNRVRFFLVWRRAQFGAGKTPSVETKHSLPGENTTPRFEDYQGSGSRHDPA